MSRHVEQLMEARATKPDSANGLRKVLREMMKVAIKLEWRDSDPTLGDDPADRRWMRYGRGRRDHWPCQPESVGS